MVLVSRASYIPPIILRLYVFICRLIAATELTAGQLRLPPCDSVFVTSAYLTFYASCLSVTAPVGLAVSCGPAPVDHIHYYVSAHCPGDHIPSTQNWVVSSLDTALFGLDSRSPLLSFVLFRPSFYLFFFPTIFLLF